MARMPGAEWLGPIPYNSGDGDQTPLEPADAIVEYWYLVEHIAAGTYLGTIAWQRNAISKVSSHFTVSKTGKIAQLVDTHDRAWTQKAGNPRSISIENEGQVGDELTPAQVEASARILAWVHQTHGIPLQVTGNPNRKGLGHHSMGAESGIDWGHSACPGEPIKRQKPEIVVRAIAITGGISMATIDEVYTLLAAINNGMTRVTIGGKTLVVCTTEWQKENSAKLDTLIAASHADRARDETMNVLLTQINAAINAGDGNVQLAPVLAKMAELRQYVEDRHLELAAAIARAEEAERHRDQLLAQAHAAAAE